MNPRANLRHYKSLSKSRMRRVRILEEELEDVKSTLRKGVAIVEDILPQMGKVVLQNYATLNEFMMESNEILKEKVK